MIAADIGHQDVVQVLVDTEADGLISTP